jgi:Raf kinase inhibitor-like YbhB/YbcL family protein
MRAFLGSALVLATFLAGCSAEKEKDAAPIMEIRSAAFAEGEEIPRRFTCDGSNIAPPLTWSGIPEGAKSLLLIVDDPDAPGGTFTHWIVFNLPPGDLTLSEGATLPAGAGQGVNDFGKPEYGGPCPPSGRHRYVHHLYALDTQYDGPSNLSRKQIDYISQGHVLAKATLMGTYQRGAS